MYGNFGKNKGKTHGAVHGLSLKHAKKNILMWFP